MMLEAISPVVYDLLPRQSELTCLASGFRFTEGPVWDSTSQSLFFSDILGNTIYRVRDQQVGVFRCPSAMSNGLAIDLRGRLISCEHAGRRITIQEHGEKPRILVDKYHGDKLNSPNDVIVRSDGTVFFTDPAYGLTAEFGVSGEQELPFQGVYVFHETSGELTLLADDFSAPNGLAFTPDESGLYVDDSDGFHVKRFDVRADGGLTNGQLFAQLDASRGEGVPDGLKVDAYGNVYVCGPSGVWIFDPKGNELGVLHVPEVCANLAWGGPDGQMLFLTASTSVYQIPTGVTGAAVHRS